MTNSDALIILNLLPGIGPVRVRRLLDLYDSPADLLARPASELARHDGIGSKLATTIAAWQDHAGLDRELRQADRAGVRLITLDDPEYPSLLREIHDPPLVLYVRGKVSALSRTSECGLAVVGSRRHTRYGTESAAKFCRSAVQAGWVIVSGLARGIDTAAHQAAVDQDGPTIGVMACGLGQIYPPENLDLAREMCEHGAVISEQPMAVRPDRRTFPMRNRIIAGLCPATLVVEAGLQSGALITARQAVDQNRQVYAIPGRIDAPQSAGCHQLIKQGAKLVETIDDILEDFSFLPGFNRFVAPEITAPESPSTTTAIAVVDGLSDLEQQILELLHNEREVPVERLVEVCHEPVSKLLASLSVLEIKRQVRQLPGRHYALYNT